jgi:hypothetical protein
MIGYSVFKGRFRHSTVESLTRSVTREISVDEISTSYNSLMVSETRVQCQVAVLGAYKLVLGYL